MAVWQIAATLKNISRYTPMSPEYIMVVEILLEKILAKL